VALLRKETCKLRHPMHLQHPVSSKTCTICATCAFPRPRVLEKISISIGSFAERDLQIKASYASLLPCILQDMHYTCYMTAVCAFPRPWVLEKRFSFCYVAIEYDNQPYEWLLAWTPAVLLASGIQRYSVLFSSDTSRSLWRGVKHST